MSSIAKPHKKIIHQYKWARYSHHGYEVSPLGDLKYTDKRARLRDGRTIEEAFNLDTKGYRLYSNHPKYGAERPSLYIMTEGELYKEYLKLWRQWVSENPDMIKDLTERVCNGRLVLTDRYSLSNINPARALTDILNERCLTNGQKIPSPHKVNRVPTP